MSQKIKSLFPPVSSLENAPSVNYEGAPAFDRGDKEALVRVLTVGTLEPTFYADAKSLTDEAIAVIDKWAVTNPRFLAQCLIYARNQGFMRLAPILGLVRLSMRNQFRDPKYPKVPNYFRRAFREVIKTPGDVQDFIAVSYEVKIRGLGQAVKEEVNKYLADLDEYRVIKYGAGGQGPSLRDVYRLTRPRFINGTKANDIARYVVKGEWDAGTLPQIDAFEQYKVAESVPEMLQCIDSGKLPHEVVTYKLPDSAEAWAHVMKQMPIFALVRNLVTLHRHKVFTDTTYGLPSITWVCDQITNRDKIRYSKMFPFRFWSAIQRAQSEGLPHRIISALDTAMEMSTDNCPQLSGRTLICNDVSGSMHSAVSEKSDMTAAEVAGVLAAAVYKRAENADIVSFDTRGYKRAVFSDWPYRDIVKAISGAGGGTNLSIPLLWAMQQEHIYQQCIWITDSEDWVRWLTDRSGVIDALREYRKRAPRCKFFFIQVMPYQHAVVPPSEPNCHYLYGWNADTTLRYIGQEISGGTQLDNIERLRYNI